MTITFDSTNNTYNLFINGQYSFADRIEFISMYSNTILFDQPATIFTHNTRYTQLVFDIPTDLASEHVEGIYKYIVYEGTTELVDGVIKVITNPGGSMNTDPYISNNEDREAQVYFRPEY
jgi:hypothetical protein